MKLFNYISFGVLGAMFSLSSCAYTDRFDEVADIVQEELPASKYTLSNLKAKYLDNKDFFIPDNVYPASNYTDVFTLYRIPETETGLIHAVIVSSDIDGNTFKKIVLRDLTDSSALDISIDAANLSATWPRGQKVTFNPAGLHIGRYADYPTIGYRTLNTDKKRQEVGRLPEVIAYDRIKAVGLPDKKLVQPKEMSITEIKEAGEAAYGQLVVLKNVTFGYYYNNDGVQIFPDSFGSANSVKDVNDEDAEDDVIFSFENAQTNNAPISRALIDAEGNSITLSTSAYARFKNKALPKGRHNVTAILGWFKDKSDRNGGYQLSIQEYATDVQLITE
ncbi:MAG: DUF5689 domain-containing protein [Bacteroidales bacterium]